MKKLLCISALLLCIVGTALAAETDVMTFGNLEYIVLDDGTVEIVRYSNREEREMIIPAEIEGRPVSSIGDKAFYNHYHLKSIVIPEGVTHIGDKAFYFCGFTTINLPESLRSLDDFAFWACSMESVTLPDNLTSIGANPFRGCEELEVINVSADHPLLMSVDGVLFNRAEMKLVSYPEDRRGNDYRIPEGTRIIGEYAFYGASRIKKISIPDTVIDIEDYAFADCGFSEITIPNSVTAVGHNPFYENELNQINVSTDHPTLAVIDGVLFSKPDQRLVSCPHYLQAEHFQVPHGTRIIGDRAFHYCSRIGSFSFPDTLISIGYGAFESCLMTSIVLPNSVTDIGEGAFHYCSQLTDITLPDGLTVLSGHVFDYCYQLKNINLPENLTTIGEGAFISCRALTSLVLPQGITDIGKDAFAYCNDLVLTVIPGSYAETYALEGSLNHVHADQ